MEGGDDGCSQHTGYLQHQQWGLPGWSQPRLIAASLIAAPGRDQLRACQNGIIVTFQSPTPSFRTRIADNDRIPDAASINETKRSQRTVRRSKGRVIWQKAAYSHLRILTVTQPHSATHASI